MIYSMYPEQNISVWIVNGKGGHKAVGTCQFTDENMDTELPKMIEELVNWK